VGCLSDTCLGGCDGSRFFFFLSDAFGDGLWTLYTMCKDGLGHSGLMKKRHHRRNIRRLYFSFDSVFEQLAISTEDYSSVHSDRQTGFTILDRFVDADVITALRELRRRSSVDGLTRIHLRGFGTAT
jgi:hypothetical protein